MLNSQAIALVAIPEALKMCLLGDEGSPEDPRRDLPETQGRVLEEIHRKQHLENPLTHFDRVGSTLPSRYGSTELFHRGACSTSHLSNSHITVDCEDDCDKDQCERNEEIRRQGRH